MATTETPRPTLSDEQLVQLLYLMKGSDSVELKATVPAPHQRSTLAALSIDALAAQIRQVWFYDTPDLALDTAGVVVRARRLQGRGGDSVVKLRPVAPIDVPDTLRQSPNMRVEVDALPGGFVCSAALKRTFDDDQEVRRVAAGETKIRKLFSKEQRAFYEQHAPSGVELDDLAVLGPIFVLKTRFTPPELGQRLVAELWFYPDGSRILELSTRTTSTAAFQAAAEIRGFLALKGVDLSGEQQTKTRYALDFFAGEAK
jgi:hypothetical protein